MGVFQSGFNQASNHSQMSTEFMDLQDRMQKKPETKFVEQLIYALNYIKMQVGMYPEGHSMISQGLDSVLDVLQEIFALKGQITINVEDDALVVDAYVLGAYGYAALAFEVHRVHDALAHLLDVAVYMRLPQYGINQRRLAVVDVRNYSYVSYVFLFYHICLYRAGFPVEGIYYDINDGLSTN